MIVLGVKQYPTSIFLKTFLLECNLELNTYMCTCTPVVQVRTGTTVPGGTCNLECTGTGTCNIKKSQREIRLFSKKKYKDNPMNLLTEP